MRESKFDIKKVLISNVSVALHHIDNAVQALRSLLENEKSLGEFERNQLYSYGVSKAQLNLVKLTNARKGLLSVTEGLKGREI